MRRLNTGKLGRKNRTNRAGIGGAVGVTTGAFIHGAHVHAGGAADAAQRLASQFIGQHGGTAVIDEDYVQVLRAVTGGYARPHGGVGVHALTGGGTRQKLQECLVVLEGGQQLLNTHERDEGIGQGQAHTAVAFGFYDGHGAGVSDTEVHARNGDLSREELLAQTVTRSLRKLGGLIGNIRVNAFNLLEEDIADFAAVTVNCRNQDVRGAVFAQLHDFFRKVGLNGVNAVLFQELVQTGLGSCHGLDLNNLVHALFANQLESNLVCLVSIARPVHVPAARGKVTLELLQHLRQVVQHIVLHHFAGGAQVLPVGQLTGDAGALIANSVGHETQVIAQLVILQLTLGVFGERFVLKDIAFAVVHDLRHTQGD